MSLADSEAATAAPLSVNRHATRELCRFAGLGLFYAYMLAPARIQEQLAIFRLDAPPAARAYGVGYPYLTLLDLAMLLAGLVLHAVFHGERPAARRNWSFSIYVFLCVVCGAVPWIAQSFGLVPFGFWDAPLAALRVLAAYVLFAALPGHSRTQAWHLHNALALMFLSSFALNLGGFASATYSNLAGRMSVSGLDFSTASYVGCALAIAGLTASGGPMRALALFGSGMLGLLTGGSRNALMLFAVALAVTCAQGFLFRRRLLAGFAAAAVVALPLVALLPSAASRVPLMRRSLDNSAYYGGGVALTASARSTFPLIDRLPLGGPAVVGRINTWAAGIQLLRMQRGWPLGSDWLIQQRLAPLGVPSHSHNGFLQTALKFGPLALLLWVAWWRAAWSGLRARSPYGPVVLFLLLSLLVDYWLLVIKAAFLLFAFIRLNDLWLSEQRARPQAAAG